jgi:superfamily II DNA/RNA helicase/very-short-patch-repair endonuclease
MNIFEFRDQLVKEFSSYIQSFIQIQDGRINAEVRKWLENGILWPDPLIQINPSFESGGTIENLVKQGILNQECNKIFRVGKNSDKGSSPLTLHKHQYDAVLAAQSGSNYVLTTGTGSGKSLAYIIPIVNQVLSYSGKRGIKAIVVYPMNALANSQFKELEKFLCNGYPDGKGPVTFKRYTGQESDDEKNRIVANPPDILLTNYVMLELILTRPRDKGLIAAAQDLKYLVLDELHTYRGRQGADVAMLVRRVRDACNAKNLQCIGTSATLSSEGSYDDQKTEVAKVATLLFGDTVKPESVIGETIKRVTPCADISSEDFVHRLKSVLSVSAYDSSKGLQEFISDPLSAWIENTFGITKEAGTGRLIRSKPRAISGDEGAARGLSELTGISEDKCKKFIQDALLAGYQIRNPNGFPVFAFRLHQMISSGDKVYASIEPDEQRYITIFGQKYVPNEDREKTLLPLVFCRECGQEYYSVKMCGEKLNEVHFEARNLSDLDGEEVMPGFLYCSSTNPWPSKFEEQLERLPEDWTEDGKGGLTIKKDQRRRMPRPVKVKPDAYEGNDGLEFQFFPAPFRFCLNCGVVYGGRQRSDFGKLNSLGYEGRSTATTILSLQAIRHLRGQDLDKMAQKLLSFTDNRQDASLQAGHFNDFVEVSLLRSGLFKAIKEAGTEGLTHDILAQKVFEALNLPIDQFASDPTVKFAGLTDTQKAFRQVIGYRIYRDLSRGWRVTSPNLEQCGLLKIDYISLDEVCSAEDVWADSHEGLVTASQEERTRISRTLLDYLRRELALKVDYLDQNYQEQIKLISKQRLCAPWAIDENEKLVHASVVLPRSTRKGDYGGYNYLSPRGGFGQFLRRKSTFSNYGKKITIEETETIIRQLLEALRQGGIVEVVTEPKEGEVPGYQIPAASMIWKAGEGKTGICDPIKTPRQSKTGAPPNPYFVEFYAGIALALKGFEAREHTAQVPNQEREKREEQFRQGALPVMYCSPTMELGVDISELNVVNMRNMPPTPANYAQRSGRAGRSGQPALVYTYCSTGSPHDQHFFKRPELMVSGSVTPPRLDLGNEDLVRSHINAIWLSEVNLYLGSSLKEILDLSNDNQELPLTESVKDDISKIKPRESAVVMAKRILQSMKDSLKDCRWYKEDWLENEMKQVALRFDEACNRWRGLYLSAMAQREKQHQIIGDASRSAEDKKNAERQRHEAEAQINLLLDSANVMQSDFYSYRYFASEGFLPGYNFPRLPLSAYIPARRVTRNKDEFLSRPRFLAISEFGPRSIIYHEGSKYEIHKVILPVGKDDIKTNQAKICPSCGYLHPLTKDFKPDLCELCQAALDTPLSCLFRLENVGTKRRDRISSDEEERRRIGYEIKTCVRFPEYDEVSGYRTAEVVDSASTIVRLTFGQPATIWRINMGWKKRSDKRLNGFNLDTERGFWLKNEMEVQDEDEYDPISQSITRVIPYVEDRRNCLLFKPDVSLEMSQMASLQAALKNAIQVQYQLEDNELAAEPLPSDTERRIILLYESAEGGAGVLKHLLDDKNALRKVARKALEICHFDPDTGEDLKRAPRSREDCEAACYDCLLSYGNQREHEYLDRKSIKDFLMQIARSDVKSSPVSLSRSEHLAQLKNLAGSSLERDWLDWMEERKYRLPSSAQKLMESCGTRPDFIYDHEKYAIYIDGPHHDYPERQNRDKSQMEALEDLGFGVIRFHHKDDWQSILDKYPGLFGRS